MNEQLLKTSGTDVLSSRKKLRKTLSEGGGGGGNHTPHVPQMVNLFKLSHLQFTVNTLAATYLLGFFFPLRLIREKVPDVDQPRRTRENKIVLTTGRQVYWNRLVIERLHEFWH